MARRIAHAEWTGELANGRGEVPPRTERWGTGRERRALEGRVMSCIRAQSRRRHSTGASPALVNPRPSASADH